MFKDTRSISLIEWSSVKRDVYQLLTEIGCQHITELGSTGHSAVSGDVDLGVVLPEGRDMLHKSLQKRFEVRKIGSGLVSFKYPLGDSCVQVDLFVATDVDSLTWLKWSKAGSVTPGIRGACRNIFLSALIKFKTDGTMYFNFDEGLFYNPRFCALTCRVRGEAIDSSTLNKGVRVTDDPDTTSAMMLDDKSTSMKTITLEGLLLETKRVLGCDGFKRFVSNVEPELEKINARRPGLVGDIKLIKKLLSGLITQSVRVPGS